VDILDAIGAWPGAVLLRSSSLAYLLTNAAHILSIALLVGPVITLDLKLLGLFGAVPLAPLHRVLTRVALAGFAGAAATGLALFSVRPGEYAQNPAFLAKLALIALAGLNVLVLTRLPSWPGADAGGTSGSVKLAAASSLVLWLAIVIAGRWIGFV